MENAIFLIERLRGLKYIFAEDILVVLTVATTENPCTVHFDEPIPKAAFARLLSCSLGNSWLSLKDSRTTDVFHAQNLKATRKVFPPGHYNNKELAKTLNSIFEEAGYKKITAEADIPTGAVVIRNPEGNKM